MNIVFISNFLNHHQLQLCLELNKLSLFTFVATIPVPGERIDLGYKNMNDEYSFVIKIYESDNQYNQAQDLINNADVVIAGSCSFPFKMILNRLEENKLTFWFSERLFKHSELMRLYPKTVKRVLSQCVKYKDKNYYLLSAGGYVSQDYNFYNAFKSKSFKWGYFPQKIDLNINEIITQKEKNSCIRILWAGRFLGWKNPEYVIYAAQLLKRMNYDFVIDMIGIGKKVKHIKKIAKRLNLEDKINFCGSLPYLEVRKYMNNANIYLFTSNRTEGWGAVLNESMNSGCAVICNNKIGSAKYLIDDNYNGILYKNKREFLDKILELVNNEKLRNQLGLNAYKTIVNEWNAEVAAERFFQFCQNKLNNKDCNFENGIMSKG
jgi:glycosyltransferase involved in cell wall biosynthesis